MIIQIIPCPIELYAKFKQDGREFTTRLVGLALVEEEQGDDSPFRCVVGLDWCDDEISLVTNSSNFCGYTDHPIALK